MISLMEKERRVLNSDRGMRANSRMEGRKDVENTFRPQEHTIKESFEEEHFLVKGPILGKTDEHIRALGILGLCMVTVCSPGLMEIGTRETTVIVKNRVKAPFIGPTVRFSEESGLEARKMERASS